MIQNRGREGGRQPIHRQENSRFRDKDSSKKFIVNEISTGKVTGTETRPGIRLAAETPVASKKMYPLTAGSC